jgi:SIR2-like protein
MFLLITPSGARMTQAAPDLASHSRQPQPAVARVLEHLVEHRILRLAYGKSDKRYEIAHDALAAALLDWHTEYVRDQTKKTASDHELAADAVRQPDSSASARADDFPYRLVGKLLREQRVVPFLGAGVALSARPMDWDRADQSKSFLPSNYELKRNLAYHCEFPETEFEASDLAEVASYFAYVAGRAALDQVLETEIGRNDYVPSETHRFLADEAQSAPLLILTTNFDTLMEQALDEKGVPYDVVAYQAPQGLKVHHDVLFLPSGSSEPSVVSGEDFRESRERTTIFRLYGRLSKHGHSFGSYVLTEEDQIDWLLNFGRSLGNAIPMSIAVSLARCHVLSLGHSARDWSQRALLRIISERDRPQSWAVALRPSQLSIMTWQRYKIKYFSVDLNDWVSRMRGATPR